MYGSSGCPLPAGETPAKLPGEFQLLPVAGELPGESSLFMLRFAEVIAGGGGAPIGCASIPGAPIFRCARCFSSMLSKPSLVKGFGSTSFMPTSGQ